MTHFITVLEYKWNGLHMILLWAEQQKLQFLTLTV